MLTGLVASLITASLVLGAFGIMLNYLTGLQKNNADLSLLITELNQAQEKLHDSEIRFRKLFEDSAEAMLLIEDEHFVDCNAAALKMLGMDNADALLQQHPSHISPPIQPDGKPSALKAAEMFALAVQHQGHIFEWEHFKANGEALLVEIILTPIADPEKKLMHVSWRNITAAKQAQTSLLESERRLHLALESARMGVWDYDFGSEKKFWSEEIYKLFNLPDLEPSMERFTEWVHPEDLGYVMQCMQSAVANRASFSADFRFIPPDGKLYWLAERGQLQFDAAGKAVRVVGTVQDITEQKLAASELEKHRHHLEELVQSRTAELAAAKESAVAANHAKGQFLANMSHEIRTPLNAILGLAQVGVRENLNPKTTLTFSHILNSGKLLLSIINDILDISKIEANRLEIEQIRLNLGDIIDQIVDMHAEPAHTKDLEFIIEESPKLPTTCIGDPLRLCQVLSNLLSNAVKFTPRGQISLKVDQEGDFLRFRVSDSGIGLSPEEIDRLFQPFTQADSSTTRRFGGSGLGLSICLRLTELMGGRLNVQSQPGLGSQFEVMLPLLAPQSATSIEKPLCIRLAGFSSEQNDYLISRLTAYEKVTTEILDIREALNQLDDACLLLAFSAISEPALAEKALQLNQQGLRIQLLCDKSNRFAIGSSPHDHFAVVNPPIRARQIIARFRSDLPPSQCNTGKYGRLNGIRILAAEDNEMNRLVLEEILSFEGATLISLENGLLVCDELRRSGASAFDILLTDIQMPVLDGYQTAQAVRQIAPELPIIGLTAHALPEERNQCLAAGMADHVSKPVDIDQLIEAILRQVKKHPVAPAEPIGLSETSEAELHGDQANKSDKPIDFAALTNRYRDKPAFLQKLLSTSLTSYQATQTALAQAILQRDINKIALLAHSIKGSATHVEASDVFELAKLTESLAQQQSEETFIQAQLLDYALRELLEYLTLLVNNQSVPVV